MADQEAIDLLERWRADLVTTVQRRTISATASDNNELVVADPNYSTVDTSASPSTSLLTPAAPWTTVAWSLGTQVLSHGIAALANEHNLSIQRRQLLAQTTAVTAENDARFWNNMFTLGASGVRAAVQYYQGSGSGMIES